MTFSDDPNGSPPGGARSRAGGDRGQEPPGYSQPGGYSGYPGSGASQGGYGQASGYGPPSYPEPEYPQQGYPQPGYQQQGYQSYAGASASPSAPASAPTYAGASATPAHPRNWLLLIIGGVVLVISLCCVLPIAYLATRGGQTKARSTPGPSLTATISQHVVYQNPMKVNDGIWPTDSDCNFQCSFQADGYHITSNVTCLASSSIPMPPPDGTVALSVELKQVGDPGATDALRGIDLRRATPGNFYQFAIDGRGDWAFVKFVNGHGTVIGGITSNSAINKGLNVTNRLKVRATGSHFDLYVNDIEVHELDDPSYGSGVPGLSGAQGADVVFAKFEVAQLLA